MSELTEEKVKQLIQDSFNERSLRSMKAVVERFLTLNPGRGCDIAGTYGLGTEFPFTVRQSGEIVPHQVA